MYGVLFRAGPEALFVGVLGAVFARALGPLVDVMMVEANQDDVLISALTAASDNFILVGIIAIMLTVLATAVLEGSVGGGR